MMLRRMLITLLLLLSSALYAQESVLFKREGIHTEIVISRDLVAEHLPQIAENFQQHAYLQFGWGDSDYFGAKKKGLLKTGKALFWPTRANVKVSPWTRSNKEKYTEIQLDMDDAALKQLFLALKRSFRYQKNGQLKLDKEVDEARFYAAKGRYFFLNTCNNWTAKMLKSAGLKMGVRRSILAGSVEKQVKRDRKRRVGTTS